jgi:hypothetical protein
MQYFFAPFIQVFWMLFGAGVWYVIKLIGFGVVTYTGLNFATDTILSYVQANFDGLPANMLAMLGILGVDKAFNILLTVFSVRLIHMGVTGGGSKTTTAWKAPADKNVLNGIFKA